jgi:YVTN family beta-propeller protein
MAPNGRRAYVSGIANSPFEDQSAPSRIPGGEGDVISVFKLKHRSRHATRAGVIRVPPPSSAPPYQTFPPQTTSRLSWPRDLAVSPDGKTLLAALNLADSAAVINTKTRSVRYVGVGHYPYGAAITNNGKYGLVTGETQGIVSVIDLASAKVVKTIQVGPHLSHPEGMAVDPTRPLAFVAIANDDQIAVINTKTLSLKKTLSLARPKGTGTAPTQVSVTRDGCDLLAADSGEDAVAVFALSRRHRCDPTHKGPRRAHRFDLVGRLPVGSYPTVAAARFATGKISWISARGLGVGPNPHGPNPNSPNDSDDFINSFQYLPSIVRGSSGILRFPSDRRIRRLTPRVDRQIHPTNAQAAPANTPIRANGPIKHVFFIVKENRTYDQVLGDDPRGDGDPHLTLFGKRITPNTHGLVRRFPLLDHVYANSEASIDGHYWTAAGAVSDYVVKNWPQNYSGRGRPYDFGAYEVSAPPKGYIFQRALAEHIPFFNYGEALAGLSPLPDKDRTSDETAINAQVLARSDIQLNGGCYDSDVAIFHPVGLDSVDIYDSSVPAGAPPTSHSRFTCFKQRFETQLLTNSVPPFNYLVLPLDHTQGVAPGQRTPDADVADNDWGLGQIVQVISHSKVWKSSLILVMEDDSQDGADHVDAHRIPALVISPYTEKGAVVHLPPHGGEDHRHEAAQPRRAPCGPAVSRDDTQAGERRPVHGDQAKGERDRDEPEHCRQPPRVAGTAAQLDRPDPPAPSRRHPVALQAWAERGSAPAGPERLAGGQRWPRRIGRGRAGASGPCCAAAAPRASRPRGLGGATRRDVQPHVIQRQRARDVLENGVQVLLVQVLGEPLQVRAETDRPQELTRLAWFVEPLLEPAVLILEPRTTQAELRIARRGEVPGAGDPANVRRKALVAIHVLKRVQELVEVADATALRLELPARSKGPVQQFEESAVIEDPVERGVGEDRVDRLAQREIEDVGDDELRPLR